jgi:hypothetical protein
VNRGNGLAGPRVAAGTVKAVRRTVAAEEGMETTASVHPLAGTMSTIVPRSLARSIILNS